MRSASVRVVLYLSVLFALPQPALAAAFFCDGQVTSIGLNDSTGRLWVSYGSIGIQQICEVSATANGIAADTCKAWFALLTAAQAQQKTIRMYYYSETPGNPASCAGFQTWTTYAPYFVHTLD